jgi:serine/threonine protein kinase
MDEPTRLGAHAGAGNRLSDRYTLEQRLGGGGMAVVYRAHDERLDRAVAVKVFDPVRWPDATHRARFEAEARAAASIAHHNVVAVHDFGVERDLLFIVMECLPGRTLADEIRAGAVAPTRLTAVLHDLLSGLAAAHAKGVLHRDIKPSNVLIDADGRAKLADFGIATSSGGELTETGVVIGTPLYLAPERVAGAAATVRTDLYAVGVVAYEALAGTPPFTGDSPIALAHAIHEGRPRPLHEVRPDAPPAMCDAVQRAMAHDPDLRPVSAIELARRLEPQDADTVPSEAVSAPDRTRRMSVQPGPEATTPRRHWPVVVAVLVGSVIVGLLVGTGIALFRDDSDSGGSPPEVTVPTGQDVPEPLREPFDRLEQVVQP